MRSGLRSRPVLLSNVETFARLAVAVRGHWDSSSLLTVSGAVTESGVLEVAASTALGHPSTRGLRPRSRRPDHRRLARHMASRNPTTLSTPANRDALGGIGGHWGAGALIAIPKDPCPVEVLHAITGYLVGEGARQCAPCILGLDAARQDLLIGAPVTDRVQGRGLCAHPTASIAAMRSGQALLAEELAKHAAGRCGAREQGVLT